MLQIALCDDEQIIIEEMKKILNSYKTDRSIDLKCVLCHNGMSLLREETAFDIVFLDIDMPGINGMDVAKKLRARKDDCIIIFVTACKEMVFDAFEVKAFRYLLKPVNQKDLFKVLDEARIEINECDKKTISFEVTQKRIVKLPFERILFIETLKRKTMVHTHEESFLSNNKISELEESLDPDQFFRTHASFIVNLEHVKTYSKGDVTLINDQQVLLSRLKENDFKKAFMKSLTR